MPEVKELDAGGGAVAAVVGKSRGGATDGGMDCHGRAEASRAEDILGERGRHGIGLFTPVEGYGSVLNPLAWTLPTATTCSCSCMITR